MIEQQEIKAAFCKGLEAFVLDYNKIKDLILAISGYVEPLNDLIDEVLDVLNNNNDSLVLVKCTYSANDDVVLITANNSSESVTLATIKRDNTGAFREFRHISSTDSITVNNSEDIKKALFRMLEVPALMSILFKLICQSSTRVFNNLNDDEKRGFMILKAPEAIEYLKSAEA